MCSTARVAAEKRWQWGGGGGGEQRTGREHAHRETQQRASEASARTRGERGARVPHVPALFTLSVKEMLG